MREFTREEMLEIARRCERIATWQIKALEDMDKEEPEFPYIRATRGSLEYFPDPNHYFPWGDNAQTADIVIRSRAFKPWWALTKEPDGDFTVFDVSGKWNVIIIPSNKRPSTAVLAAVLEGGYDTRMEVMK
uniref:Uncharacterized protein n=1 Tax=viral metagenome TaxID=1070528 RepID=A0A6M3XWW8_9ZZZZ